MKRLLLVLALLLTSCGQDSAHKYFKAQHAQDRQDNEWANARGFWLQVGTEKVFVYHQYVDNAFDTGNGSWLVYQTDGQMLYGLMLGYGSANMPD